jgi:hypothetical protein
LASLNHFAGKTVSGLFGGNPFLLGDTLFKKAYHPLGVFSQNWTVSAVKIILAIGIFVQPLFGQAPDQGCEKSFSELSALHFLVHTPSPAEIANVNGEPVDRVERELELKTTQFESVFVGYGFLYGLVGAFFLPKWIRTVLPDANQYSLVAHYSNFGSTLLGMSLLSSFEKSSGIPRWLFISGGYASAIAFNALHEWKVAAVGMRPIDTGDIAYGAAGATVGLGMMLIKPKWVAYRLMRNELQRNGTGRPPQ